MIGERPEIGHLAVGGDRAIRRRDIDDDEVSALLRCVLQKCRQARRPPGEDPCRRRATPSPRPAGVRLISKTISRSSLDLDAAVGSSSAPTPRPRTGYSPAASNCPWRRCRARSRSNGQGRHRDRRAAEPFRADRPRLLTRRFEQRDCLLAFDVLARHAVETGGGDDFASLAAGAAIQLRDQTAHRLRAARQEAIRGTRAASYQNGDERPSIARLPADARASPSIHSKRICIVVGSAGPKPISIRVPTGWSTLVTLMTAVEPSDLRAQLDPAVAGDDGERALATPARRRRRRAGRCRARRAAAGAATCVDRIGRRMQKSSAISSGVPSSPGPSSSTKTCRVTVDQAESDRAGYRARCRLAL